MRTVTLLLAIAVISAPALGLPPEELAKIVNTKGKTGIADVWDLLALTDSPHCEGESPTARIDFGQFDSESAEVAVLEITGVGHGDLLFLGKTPTSWRCLGHEIAGARSKPVEILKSWGVGLLCAVNYHGSGTGCSGDSEKWFLLLPERAVEVCTFFSESSQLIEGLGEGSSVEDYEASVEECEGDPESVSFRFDLKWSLAFENKVGVCRLEDVLEVKATASVTINRLSGEILVKAPELGDSWAGIDQLERGDLRLICALAPRRLADLARTAPVSCGAFMGRCAAACEDPCLAAELAGILRERGLTESPPEPDPGECEGELPATK